MSTEFDDLVRKEKAKNAQDEEWAAFGAKHGIDSRYSRLIRSDPNLAWQPEGNLRDVAQRLAEVAPLSKPGWVVEDSPVGPLFWEESVSSWTQPPGWTDPAPGRYPSADQKAQLEAWHSQVKARWDTEFTKVTAEGFGTDTDTDWTCFVLSDGRIAYRRPSLDDSEVRYVMVYAAKLLASR